MPVMLERWNDDKMDDLGARVGGLEVGAARVEAKVDGLGVRMDERFEQVDKRFEQVDKRFEQVDKRFEQVDKRFERIEGELVEQRREIKAGFEKVNGLFHRMQWNLVTVAGGIIAALITAPHL